MANLGTLYPTGIDDFPKPSSSTAMNSAGFEHDLIHSGLADAINKIEARLGISGSSDGASVDFLSQRAHGPHSGAWNRVGNFAVDLDGNPYVTLNITGDITLSTQSSSRPTTSGTAKSVNIRAIAGSDVRYISFAEGMKVIGYIAPIAVPANHTSVITVTSWGPFETDSVVGFGVEV